MVRIGWPARCSSLDVMRFASVIAALTRARPNLTRISINTMTPVLFSPRENLHPLLPRAPNYLPMGARLYPSQSPRFHPYLPLLPPSLPFDTCSNDPRGSTRGHSGLYQATRIYRRVQSLHRFLTEAGHTDDGHFPTFSTCFNTDTVDSCAYKYIRKYGTGK